MNSDDKAAASSVDLLRLDFDLAHPPEKVWRALTDPALLAEWLLPVVGFRLEQGAAFTFNAPPQPGWDGTVNCRVREIDPHRKMSWAWVVGDIDTVVEISHTPLEGGARTRMTIEQSGFKADQKQALGGARYGWKMMSGRLTELLARIP
jgi:uncharacterized protein YndB with AHSA1/START domain